MINPTDLDLTSLPQLPLNFYPNLPAIATLYFCTSHGQILYIGITKNLNTRWRSHHKIYELSQHSEVIIHWLPLEPDQLTTELEQAFIKHWEPLLNGRGYEAPPLESVKVTQSGWQVLDKLIAVYPIAARIFILLASQLNSQNEVSITQEAIAEKLDLSVRSVQRATAWLEAEKTITRTNLRASSYTYWVNPEYLHK